MNELSSTLNDSIFENWEALLEEWTPDSLVGRDEKLTQYHAVLQPVMNDETSSNIFLYGKTGVGKSAVTRYLLRTLEGGATDVPELKLTTIEINCDELNTSHQVAVKLINELREPGRQISNTGYPQANVYEFLFDKRNLVVGTAAGTGLILLAVAPSFYNTVGAALSLQSRFVTASLLGNLFLLLMVFYLTTILKETQRDAVDLSRSISVADAASDVRPDGDAQPITVVILACNEAKSIAPIVSSLLEQIAGYPIEAIVISDGSDDATATRAGEAGAIVTEYPINQRQGGILRTDFQLAERRDSGVVVTMDADGQHPVEELENLVRSVLDGETDYVMGFRYRGVDRTDHSVVRRAGIRFFTWLINVLTKSRITDCTNGYRAIRGSEIENLTLTEERFSAPELIIEAPKHRIREVPIVIKGWERGEIKKPKLGYALGLMQTIVATWIR